MKHAKTVLLWVFSVLIALIVAQQGWAKFFEDGRWTRSFAEWGYPAWFRILVGVGEVGGGAALLIPPVAMYGAVVVAAIMLGAVGTLLLDGRGVDAVTPVIYGVLAGWIAWERRKLPVWGNAKP